MRVDQPPLSALQAAGQSRRSESTSAAGVRGHAVYADELKNFFKKKMQRPDRIFNPAAPNGAHRGTRTRCATDCARSAHLLARLVRLGLPYGFFTELPMELNRSAGQRLSAHKQVERPTHLHS